MRIIRLVAAVIVVGIGAIPGIVHANNDLDARKAIQLRYNQFNNAYTKKDFKTVTEVFSPNCVMNLVSEGRSMSVAKVLRGMEAVSKSLTVSHAQTHIVSIKKASKNGFTVEAIWTANSSYSPVNHSKEDPARHSKAKQIYKDSWARTGSTWQITHRIIEDSDDDTQLQKK